jgi:hypothetical protein
MGALISSADAASRLAREIFRGSRARCIRHIRLRAGFFFEARAGAGGGLHACFIMFAPFTFTR